MSRFLDLDVVTVDVDTDSLGTFAGEVERVGTPWETAVAKARLGMEASGRTLGLATEGSIGPDDTMPFLVADLELVVLVDDERGIVIGEGEVDYGIPTAAADVDISATSGLGVDSGLLERAGFPAHGLIVRPLSGIVGITKGIHDADELRRAMERCMRESGSNVVRIESDLRAHHHPTRRVVIARAAERLAERLARLCPSCRCPGWGVGRRSRGAPCSVCRSATRIVRSEQFVCASCPHEEEVPTDAAAGVDPQYCPRCNP
ncbi:MAG: hypothetical protein FGM29_06595 [Actinobacteria bacterium]|nr:hypothetical protein [Actinomycetota bacterium]